MALSKKKYHLQDTCGMKCYLLTLSKFVFTCSFDLLKREFFSKFNEISLKKRNINFEALFAPSFDVLHSSQMVYLHHTKLIFQNLLLYCTKTVPENHNQLFHFRHGGGTNFLVLAQTRHAICHGCPDIICVKYSFFWVDFCSENTAFCQKWCFCSILQSFSCPQAYLG